MRFGLLATMCALLLAAGCSFRVDGVALPANDPPPLPDPGPTSGPVADDRGLPPAPDLGPDLTPTGPITCDLNTPCPLGLICMSRLGEPGLCVATCNGQVCAQDEVCVDPRGGPPICARACTPGPGPGSCGGGGPGPGYRRCCNATPVAACLTDEQCTGD
jgi:hypothetical protein